MPIARQVKNPGSRGSDARFDTGMMRPTGDGRLTDGSYFYDAEGRDLGGRAKEWINGLPGEDDNGGGGGGGGFAGAAVMGQMVAQGLAEYKKALARMNQNRQNTLTQYGYAGDIDAETGVMKNMRVDGSNPFGIYQKLRRGNAQQFEGLRDASMERGLGRKGLGAQGVSNARWQWGEADTSMAQALTGTMSGYDETQQAAWQTYQNLLWQAQLEAARSSDPGGGYDPGDYYDEGGDPGTSPVIQYVGANMAGLRAQAAKQQAAAKKPAPKTQVGRAPANPKPKPAPKPPARRSGI